MTRSDREDGSKVARLPLHWGPVLDRVLGGRINFFRRQEHHCPYAGAPRLANGKCERGGTLVVRKVGDGEGVMVAEGKRRSARVVPQHFGRLWPRLRVCCFHPAVGDL